MSTCTGKYPGGVWDKAEEVSFFTGNVWFARGKGKFYLSRGVNAYI